MIKNRQTKGITLIALVITIIVLIILAGVTIAMLTGENGILTKANSAQTENTVGREKEEISIAYNAAKIEKSKNGDLSEVKGAELKSSLLEDKVNVTISGDNPIVIKFDSSKNIYEVDINGNIEGPKTQEGEEIEKVESTSSLWKFDVATQAIQKYLGSDIGTITEIIVPNYIDGIQVKKIEAEYDKANYRFFPIMECDEKGNSKAKNLEKIVISEGIESIGGGTFPELPILSTLILNKDLKRIEDGYAFLGNRNLTNVILPEGLEYLGERAFMFCSGITEITLPASLQDAGDESLATYEYIEITALGNGNGTYFVKQDSYEKPTQNGEINFVNENTVIVTCGGAYGNDGGLTMFKTNKETGEAIVEKVINGTGGGTFIIPSSVNGYAVTRIGHNVKIPANYTELPSSIEYIEKGRFSELNNFGTEKSIDELKSLKVEEGAILEGTEIRVQNEIITVAEFLLNCTIVPATH